ncbi:hypothetical protein [Phascolarctobacterium faecium]|uniref:hypothetical protein n=1 Tax=Phascolarctobacterium faecium TaxID=33025 RepID=UPI00204AB869|nr:MAG TPA: hypothetical protein [Caudoviricetes sp.]
MDTKKTEVTICITDEEIMEINPLIQEAIECTTEDDSLSDSEKELQLNHLHEVYDQLNGKENNLDSFQMLATVKDLAEDELDFYDDLCSDGNMLIELPSQQLLRSVVHKIEIFFEDCHVRFV